MNRSRWFKAAGLVGTFILVLSFLIQPTFFVSAHSGDNSSDKIHACQLNLLGIVGIVRVVDDNGSCNGGETALHWVESVDLPDAWPKIITGGLDSIGDRLAGFDFSDGIVSYASFLNTTDLTGTSFAGSLFKNVQFFDMVADGMDLSNTETSELTIGGSSMIGLDAAGADLSDRFKVNTSDLTNANFSNADLSTAEFRNSDLTDADFTGATTTGITWVNTTCPDGTNSNSNGNTCAGHL